MTFFHFLDNWTVSFAMTSIAIMGFLLFFLFVVCLLSRNNEFREIFSLARMTLWSYVALAKSCIFSATRTGKPPFFRKKLNFIHFFLEFKNGIKIIIIFKKPIPIIFFNSKGIVWELHFLHLAFFKVPHQYFREHLHLNCFKYREVI